MFIRKFNNIVKMSVLPIALIYRFNAIPIKVLAWYFVNINRLTLSQWKGKRSKIANTILKNKGLTVHDSKT